MLKLYVEPLTAGTNLRLCEFLGQRAVENISPAVDCADRMRRNLIEMPFNDWCIVLRNFRKLQLECRFFASVNEGLAISVNFLVDGFSSVVSEHACRLITSDIFTSQEVERFLISSISRHSKSCRSHRRT